MELLHIQQAVLPACPDIVCRIELYFRFIWQHKRCFDMADCFHNFHRDNGIWNDNHPRSDKQRHQTA